MRLSRRTALRLLTCAPLAATGACRTAANFGKLGEIREPAPKLQAFPSAAAAAAAIAGGPIIDVHAHFFNASDVPVRGFLAECVAHSRPKAVQALLRAAGALAERLAAAAPSAAKELRDLARFTGEGAAVSIDDVSAARRREDRKTAENLADVIRNSEFQRLYRSMQDSGQSAAAQPARSDPLSRDEILKIVSDAEGPASRSAEAAPALAKRGDAAMADGVLGFLKYMLSPRWVNVQTYMTTFTAGRKDVGIDAVLGALVDFDYWLCCPPRSAHHDQVVLHQRLFDLYSTSSPQGGPYFYPVVAYNPWTDIAQGGAGLARVIDACTNRHFVAAKIYPPTGFRPAGNATIPESQLTKPHPDTTALDARLKAFFEACAERHIPVLAHAAPSNGRDEFHDDFGGPAGWEALLARYAANAGIQRVDFGHFGGGRRNWTAEFAALISRHPTMSLYGDLGYWDELMCDSGAPDACAAARRQLEEAMKVPIAGTADTVLDRVMFATDWLMLSQVKGWADYPRHVRDALRQIPGLGEAGLAKVLGGNALKCFPGLQPGRRAETGHGD